MNKVIILEGPDGAGKTWTANHLKMAGWEVHHEGPPEGDPFQHYVGRLLKYLRGKTPVVLDRFHLGEYVYGPVKRDTNYMTATGLRIFNRICRAYNVAQVICLPPWGDVQFAWNNRRGTEYLKEIDDLHEVYHRYEGLLLHKSYLHADWTKKKWTAEHLGRWEGFRTPALPLGTIGHQTARVLVVGEQSNTDYDLPFVHLGNSSGYLNFALRSAGFPERDLAFTNALTLRGAERSLKEVFAHLPAFRIAVALGQKAADACRRADLPFVKIHHPSQHKRFHHKKKDAYIETLKGIHEKLS
jgi:hypothetical protein